MDITVDIAKKLIEEQFPKWKHLEIYPVAKSGHDNRTFHLGKQMSIRLPSGEGYASQAAKESQWLPYLQEHLHFPVSKPLAVGKPTEYYPYPWAVHAWIEGDTLLDCPNVNQKTFAQDLANALKSLQSVSCVGAPAPGLHNYYRGASPKVYHNQTMESLEKLKNRLPIEKLKKIWEQCIAEDYKGSPVFVHGDIAPGNILLRNNQFYGLIDFGVLGTGDPACDYAMAWTYFNKEARAAFLQNLPFDMIHRARGWALWKALLTYDDKNEFFKENARYTIRVILEEYPFDK